MPPGRWTTSWRALRWATVLGPVAYVMGLELVEDFLLDGPLGRWPAHAVTFAAILLGALLVSTYVFRTVDRVEARLRQQNRDLAALNDIARVASGSLELDDLLARVLEATLQVTGSDAAEVFLLDERGQTLLQRRHHGLFPEAFAEVTGFPIGRGIPGLVAATGAPIMIDDLAAEPRLQRQGLVRQGLRAMASVPLRAKDRVVGVLNVARRQDPYAADEITLLTAIGNQVGVAVENAQLYRDVQQTAEYLNALIETSADAMITADLQGRILSWNRGAEEIYGWRREEAVGQVLPMVPPELRPEAHALMDRLKQGETIRNLETHRRNKHGRIIDVVVTVSPLRDAQQQIVGGLGVSKDVTELKRLERALQEQQRSLAVLQERERIGMDLHDGAIQSLYSVGLWLESCLPLLSSAPQEVAARLERATDDVTEIIRQIRNYIFDLRTQGLQEGRLAEGLVALADELRAHTIMDVAVTADPAAAAVSEGLSPDQAADLFLVAREALTNVLKHARASRAQVRLELGAACLDLVIHDDGLGFDPAAQASAGGRGLRNIAERAQRLGARLRLDSLPGQGTEVRLELPLQEVVHG